MEGTIISHLAHSPIQHKKLSRLAAISMMNWLLSAIHSASYRRGFIYME